jgi:hypothetical protein
MNLIGKSGRIPSEDDVNHFVEQMWLKPWWSFDNNNYTGSSSFRGVDITDMATQTKILDTEDLAYGAYVQEATEILMLALREIVGTPGTSRPTQWSTAPISIESLAYMYGERDDVDLSSMKRIDQRNTSQWIEAEGEIHYINNRISEYNSVVVPFQLRKTMHHELTLINFNAGTGKAGVSHEGRLKVNSDADIEDFMRDHINEAHRALWFSFSETGENYKASVIDIDYHGLDVSEKQKKRVVKQVARKMIAAGHPILIQFSGTGYHVWFGPGNGIALSDRHVIQAIIRKALGKIDGATYDSAEAKIETLAHLNITVEKKRAPWSMFFGLHYKPHTKSSPVQGTGLAKIPLTLDALDSFDPIHDAHPETVLRNFGALSQLVDRFFDEVEVGYGYEDEDNVSGALPCHRSESHEPDHPLAKTATEWKKSDKFESYNFDDALDFFDNKSELAVTPKFNGILCAIHYKERGGHKSDGKILTTTRKVISRKFGATDSKQPVTTIMSTKGGVLLWENQVTKEFEDTCKKRGIREALFLGELFEYDAFGVVRGPHAVTSTIMRKDISSSAFKQLRFSLFDALSINNSKVNVEYRLRHAELEPFAGDRIKVVDMEYLSESIPYRLEALWALHVGENEQEGLVIHHDGNRYKVKRKHTVDAVIIGVNTASKSWLANRKNRHIFHVALAKDTKEGSPTYIHMGPVNWGPGWDNEKQGELFDMVMGERGPSGRYESTIGLPSFDEIPLFADIQLVDPKVVVELEYQHLSEKSTPTFALYHRQETKSTHLVRPKTGYRLGRTGLQARRMVGPAVIKSLREDKDPYSTYDLRVEQVDGAGGLELGIAKKNPSNVSGYPAWLKYFSDMFPITPSTGAELDTALICDKSLSKMSFRNGPQGFPRSTPWEMNIEAYRKLRNMYLRSGRGKEFGGFSSDEKIYYGSSHSLASINLWLTNDVDGADFVFHTHPSVDYQPPSFSHISGADLASSLTSRYVYGVEWELIVVPEGFLWFSARGVAKDSKLYKAFKDLKDNPSKKQTKKLTSLFTAEQKKVEKAFAWAYKTLEKQTAADEKKNIWYTTHPSWYVSDLIDLLNESGKCDTFFATVFVPLYLFGPDYTRRRFEGIRKNSSTGWFGVAKQRETLAAWPHVVGDPDRPETIVVSAGVLGPDGERMAKSIKLETEFAQAIARGKRADPAEKGYKLYLPRWSIRNQTGYPFVLGMPVSMQMDFADRLGGPSGPSVAKVGTKQGEMRATTEQYDLAYKEYKPRQAKNDKELFLIQSNEMPAFESYDPLDPDAAVIGPKWRTRYDESYYEEGSRKPGEYYKDLQKAMSQSNYNRNDKDKVAYLRSLYDRMGVSAAEIKTNPPTGIDEWDKRVFEFIADHREWQETPIDQPWPEYALAVYPPWEFPMLEKGRMLMEAIEAYSLDDSETANVRQEYSSTTAMVGSPLDNLLMGLDADDEDESEDDEEDEYDDSTE